MTHALSGSPRLGTRASPLASFMPGYPLLERAEQGTTKGPAIVH